MDARQHFKNERGVGLVATAVVLAALLTATVVGVGVGRHAFTGTEVQTVAEVAATAAAQARLAPGASDASARAAAQSVVPYNQVDGHTASVASSNLVIDFGNFDAGNFNAGGEPTNAVRATANVAVPNIFPVSIPGIFNLNADSSGNSTVTKIAIAAFSSVGAAQPTLPLAICSACFPSDCFDSSCLPVLSQTPSPSNTAAWTGFLSGHSANTIDSFFATPCGKGTATPPLLTAHTDSIDVINGEVDKAMKDLQCMVCPPINTPSFLVPVIDCGASCGGATSGNKLVVGFATVVINSFNLANGKTGLCSGNPKSTNLGGLFNADVPGPPGGGNFGTGFVALVG